MRNQSTATVALIGRPNVGKSSLYNRLLHARRAITEKTPGVTRDALVAQWHCNDIAVDLIDTGGYTDSQEHLAQSISRQTQVTAERADVILFVVDIDGIVAHDILVADCIRNFKGAIICVVNKADNEQREFELGNFYRLGFDTVLSVSALHNRNIDTLINVIYQQLSALAVNNGITHHENSAHVVRPIQDEQHTIDTRLPNVADSPHAQCAIAIIGKPNTGKSTLLNAITNSATAIVSDIAGTTRDTVCADQIYSHHDPPLSMRFLDTAGLRRKSNVDSDIEYYATVRAGSAINAADIVLLVIDVTDNLSQQDKKIAHLAVSHGKGLIFVLNKIDIYKKQQHAIVAASNFIRAHFPLLAFAPIIQISARTSYGIPSLMKEIVKTWTTLHKRISTAQLNKYAITWYEQLKTHGTYKLRYVTQSGINPVEFIFFFNSLKRLPRTLKHFFINKIRNNFDFNGIPLLIYFRGGERRNG